MPRIQEFLERVELRRSMTSASLDQRVRTTFGQFFTPRPSADLLASMAPLPEPEGWRLIDPGAGVGSLTAALVARWLTETDLPTMAVIAYEIDPHLVGLLKVTLVEATKLAASLGRKLDTDVREANFILNPPTMGVGNVILMNPPYKKLGVHSAERTALTRSDHPVRVTNLYAAFLIRAVRSLAPGDALVAITPRSFANGPYFRDLRSELLTRAKFRRIHVFESRNRIFADADVLQENIIFSMQLAAPSAKVIITTSRDATDNVEILTRHHDQIVHRADSQHFIRLPLNENALAVAERMMSMPCTLTNFGCSVSTGRVVDFRTRTHLRMRPSKGTVPLVYPQNLHNGKIDWPIVFRKAQALLHDTTTTDLLLPNEHYVVVKRFTSKEETRRVVAALASPSAFEDAEKVAYENHLNVFHAGNCGLDVLLATGLTAYLNSHLVDDYIRQFNGHTQINATDLRELRYPTVAQLSTLGAGAAKLGNLSDSDAIEDLLIKVMSESKETRMAAVA